MAHKKSRYEKYQEASDASTLELIERDHVSVRSLTASHERHTRSLDRVAQHLVDVGLEFDLAYRGDVHTTEGYDLVISVGGDGTVLDLSHRLDETPIMGVNSDPELSFGYFCAGVAEELPELLEQVIEESWEPRELMRFNIRLNGEEVGYPVLNEVLIAHANPAAVTKYILRIGEFEDEQQKSSGIWISTAAGSTAAIRSAGGYVLPLQSRDIQYLVREPCPPRDHAYRHIKGIRAVEDGFEVISKMQDGRIYIDGPHIGFQFKLGDSVSIHPDAPSLFIYGLDETERE